MGAFDRFAKTYTKGQMIFCEYEPGNTFYLIQEGRVQITKVMGDLEKAVDILHPGELFGEMAILEEAPRSASAIALDKVTLLEFNRANFEILMQGNPQIALTLLKTFVKRIHDQRRRFLILKLEDVQARVADVFLMFFEGQNPRNQEQDRWEFPVTVNDVAHWAGLPPERVKAVVNQFVKQNRMSVFPDKIVVNNIHDLQRLVASRRREQG
ncbi:MULTISPECIES: Crp/Fnr family transcriptional regulator [Alkalispirochaeta]|nr:MULTISPECIES: Crp/Fnr family transcriptional regulator [Alkalispirochaeta]